MSKIKDMSFMEHTPYSQIVMSEEAATCWANTFSESEIGEINLNGDKLSKLFQGFTRKKLDIPFTSTSLKNHLPLFY